MTLGALTEIIGDENFFIEELKKLNVHGYHIYMFLWKNTKNISKKREKIQKLSPENEKMAD